MSFLAKNKPLILILLLIFSVSVVYAFAYRIRPVVDAAAYDAIAQNLLAGCGFKEICTESYQADTAILRAGPGYEFFLAGIYAVFGHYYEAVWLLQALFHTVTAFLLYAIVRKLFPEKPAALGYATLICFGFWPDLIEISAMLLTETVYLFFTVLAVWYFVRLVHSKQNISSGFLLGLLTGLAILVRPPIILFAAIFVGFFLLAKKYQVVGGILAGLTAALLPWTYRNYLVYHEIIVTTMIGQFNLWAGNTLTSAGGQITSEANPVAEYVQAHGVVGFTDAASHAFREFLLFHSWVFVKLCFLRLLRYVSLIRPMGFWFYQEGIKQLVFVAASGLWIAVAFIGGYAGLTALALKRKGFWYVIALLALSAPLLLLPTVVESRYRFQIYPFLAIGFGYCFYALREERSQIKRPLLITICVLAVLTLVDVLVSIGPIIEHLKLFA